LHLYIHLYIILYLFYYQSKYSSSVYNGLFNKNSFTSFLNWLNSSVCLSSVDRWLNNLIPVLITLSWNEDVLHGCTWCVMGSYHLNNMGGWEDNIKTDLKEINKVCGRTWPYLYGWCVETHKHTHTHSHKYMHMCT